MRFSSKLIIPYLSFASLYIPLSLACSDDANHGHSHAKRRAIRPSPPTRPLIWSDFNVIATTDTHGWLGGHKHLSEPEPNYSADFGDFYSFVKHMNETAIAKDVDLLLVDSGDIHDGTGLSDGFPKGGVDGHDSDEFIKSLPYDLLTIGNHELYEYADSNDTYYNFVPHWKGRYLTSNVNITINNQNVSFGERYRKFTTRKGRNIMSYGVMFNFNPGKANSNLTVETVAEMVQKQWFKDSLELKPEPDLFVLVGHMPVFNDTLNQWPVVFNAIRAIHKTTPILIFGGHTHKRDCYQMDGRSMSLESGRYMETVGFMSVNLSEINTDKNLTFNRRYIDPNRLSYEAHTTKSSLYFDTSEGRNVSRNITELEEKYDLNHLFGKAPQDYLLYNAPYPANNSVYSLYMDEAAPFVFSANISSTNKNKIIILNSGTLRFDLYSGPFTKNDKFSVTFHPDVFNAIKDVPFSVAKQVLQTMNSPKLNLKRDTAEENISHEAYNGDVHGTFVEWLKEMQRKRELASDEELESDEDLTLGYVTIDQCPGQGDDTAHTGLKVYDIPKYVSSPNPNVSDSTPVDIVFNDYIMPNVIKALNTLQNTTKYNDSSAILYSNVTTDDVLPNFAVSKWH